MGCQLFSFDRVTYVLLIAIAASQLVEGEEMCLQQAMIKNAFPPSLQTLRD